MIWFPLSPPNFVMKIVIYSWSANLASLYNFILVRSLVLSCLDISNILPFFYTHGLSPQVSGLHQWSISSRNLRHPTVATNEWNKLPGDLRSCISTSLFMKKLKFIHLFVLTYEWFIFMNNTLVYNVCIKGILNKNNNIKMYYHFLLQY